MITLDTLRYDTFATDGGDSSTGAMPELRARADRGRVFDRFYAPATTTQPSHATFLTGQHPWQHGVPRNGVVLADVHETIPELLARDGYATAAVVASFPVHSRFGFDQGFDVYHEEFERRMTDTWNDHQIEGGAFFSLADSVVDRALEVIDSTRGAKQFFWFHLFDPHSPYGDTTGQNLGPPQMLDLVRSGRVPVNTLLEQARQLYRQDVRFMDAALGRLLRRLDDGVETHIVVVSDHGESFGEGGSLGHGKRLTREQIHVPCVVLSPRVEPGRSAEPVGGVDIAATLLALAGLSDHPPGARDLSAAGIPSARVFGMRRTYDEPFAETRIDLVDHVIDPAARLFFAVDGEQTLVGNRDRITLGDEGPELEDAGLAERLKLLFNAFEAELDNAGMEELLDEETLQKLRALGYVR